MKYLIGLIFSFSCFATTLTGSLDNPDGSGANGMLYLNVAQQAALSSSGGCGGPIEIVPATGKGVAFKITNGALPGTPTVYGNDCMLPQGVYYNVEFDDNSGNVLFQDRWLITGSSINIGTIVSAVISGTTGTLGSTGVVLTVPSGAQTINQPSGMPLSVNLLTVTNTLNFPNGGFCNTGGCTNLITNVVDLTSVQTIGNVKTFQYGVNANTCVGGCGYQALGIDAGDIAYQIRDNFAVGSCSTPPCFPWEVDTYGNTSMAGSLNLTGVLSKLQLRGTTLIDNNGDFLGAGVDVCINLASPYTNCAMGAGDGIGARRFNPYDGSGGAALAGMDVLIDVAAGTITCNGTPATTGIKVVGGVIVNCS